MGLLSTGCVDHSMVQSATNTTPGQPAATLSDSTSLQTTPAPSLPQSTANDQHKDIDGDEIPDTSDTCISQSEIWNGFEDTDGCPDEIPPELAALTNEPLRGIAFVSGSSELLKRSFQALDHVVDVLRRFPSVRIMVIGHTDSTETCKHSNTLSSDRAISVRRYLIDHGIDESRVETRGDCGREPIDTNKTSAGRRRNRRIEVRLIGAL